MCRIFSRSANKSTSLTFSVSDCFGVYGYAAVDDFACSVKRKTCSMFVARRPFNSRRLCRRRSMSFRFLSDLAACRTLSLYFLGPDNLESTFKSAN